MERGLLIAITALRAFLNSWVGGRRAYKRYLPHFKDIETYWQPLAVLEDQSWLKDRIDDVNALKSLIVAIERVSVELANGLLTSNSPSEEIRRKYLGVCRERTTQLDTSLREAFNVLGRLREELFGITRSIPNVNDDHLVVDVML